MEDYFRRLLSNRACTRCSAPQRLSRRNTKGGSIGRATHRSCKSCGTSHFRYSCVFAGGNKFVRVVAGRRRDSLHFCRCIGFLLAECKRDDTRRVFREYSTSTMYIENNLEMLHKYSTPYAYTLGNMTRARVTYDGLPLHAQRLHPIQRFVGITFYGIAARTFRS